MTKGVLVMEIKNGTARFEGLVPTPVRGIVRSGAGVVNTLSTGRTGTAVSAPVVSTLVDAGADACPWIRLT